MNPLVEATLYRDAGAVKRYHVKRVQRTQTIAEHTFGILMLIKQVCPDCRKEVYNAVLHHDLPELFTGDIPAPIKRVHPELRPLMERIEEDLVPLHQDIPLSIPEAILLKWADRMELVLWCLEEVRLGNTFCRATVARGLGWILMAKIPDEAVALTDAAVADAWTLGIAPATGAELEMNA